MRGFRRGCGLVSAALLVTASSLAQVLPPPPAGPEAGRTLSGSPRLTVREFRFEGNTVFSGAELAAVTAPYANREIRGDELEEARRAVSVHYVQRGYVNSGAILPDQDPGDGVVVIRVVEGSLSEIELHGNRWLRDGYVLGRIQRWGGAPLNLDELKEGLQSLRQNPNVSRINAELKPGSRPGEGILDVDVRDRQPFRVGVQVDNQRPASVGENQLWLLASDVNLTGHSDVLDVRYGVAQGTSRAVEWSGADNLEAGYVVPVSRYDTTLSLRGSRLNTSLVEETFVPLDVGSVTTSYGGGVAAAVLPDLQPGGCGVDRVRSPAQRIHAARAVFQFVTRGGGWGDDGLGSAVGAGVDPARAGACPRVEVHLQLRVGRAGGDRQSGVRGAERALFFVGGSGPVFAAAVPHPEPAGASGHRAMDGGAPARSGAVECGRHGVGAWVPGEPARAGHRDFLDGGGPDSGGVRPVGGGHCASGAVFSTRAVRGTSGVRRIPPSFPAWASGCWRRRAVTSRPSCTGGIRCGTSIRSTTGVRRILGCISG
jgi:hypothetical protein